jgi:hypothetical protein
MKYTAAACGRRTGMARPISPSAAPDAAVAALAPPASGVPILGRRDRLAAPGSRGGSRTGFADQVRSEHHPALWRSSTAAQSVFCR